MKIDYSRPEYYYNRELSWVAFDHRVLGEARDKSLRVLRHLIWMNSLWCVWHPLKIW